MSGENTIYSKVYMWMFIGLMVTFLTGYCLSINEVLMVNVLSIGIIPIVLIELGIAIFFGLRIRKMSPLTAKICYLIYSFTTGLTFSSIFIIYKLSSVMGIFAVTSILFLIFALIGYFTKIDLSKIGSILAMLLLGIIIVSLINIFIGSTGLEFILSIITIVVFLGYVAYDMHTIKYLIADVGEDKGAVYGAFQLYLDFINLFINLLKIFGRSND